MWPHLSEDEHFNEYEAMRCYLSDNNKDDVEDLLMVFLFIMKFCLTNPFRKHMESIQLRMQTVKQYKEVTN